MFEISALTGEGCPQLCYAIQTDFDAKKAQRDEAEEHDADPRFQNQDLDDEEVND